MNDMLIGNPRCKRCGEHHPELWDCSTAFVHAFEPARESLARLEAFLADHSNELGSLSVEVIAREGEGWDFSLETLRDIAIAARAGVSLATGPKQDSGTGAK